METIFFIVGFWTGLILVCEVNFSPDWKLFLIKLAFFWAVKNSRKLAYEIQNLLNNKSKIKQIGINARHYALKNFDINRIVESHIKIYKEMI